MRRTYAIKEAFLTVQGEGAKAGTPAVFVRFTGCNYWSGLEKHRHTSSLCPFCDTDFRGTDGMNGGRYDAEELAEKIADLGPRAPLVVFTGGEPLLQLDAHVVRAVKARGYTVSVETNGSVALPPDRHGIDWVVCSPKSAERLKLRSADELKVIYPAQSPLQYRSLVKASHLWVQPEDGPCGKREESTHAALNFAHEHPPWRVSVQTHKYLGVP